MGDPLAFQALADFDSRLRGLPREAQEYFEKNRESMSDEEFWEFFEWMTTKLPQATPDPYAWDVEELDELLG